MRRREHQRLHRAVDAWVDAELNDERMQVVAVHVRHCWGCSSAAETARLVKRSLRRLAESQTPPLSSARLRRMAAGLAGR